MQEDLISNNFVENVNKNIVKKTLWLAKSVLNLSIVYAILDLLEWYIAVSNSWGHTFKYNSTFFEYRIHPVIAVIILGMAIVANTWHVKASDLINQSYDKADADLFNTGYTFFYKAAKLSLVAFCISIATISIRLLLK